MPQWAGLLISVGEAGAHHFVSVRLPWVPVRAAARRHEIFRGPYREICSPPDAAGAQNKPMMQQSAELRVALPRQRASGHAATQTGSDTKAHGNVATSDASKGSLCLFPNEWSGVEWSAPDGLGFAPLATPIDTCTSLVLQSPDELLCSLSLQRTWPMQLETKLHPKLGMAMANTWLWIERKARMCRSKPWPVQCYCRLPHLTPLVSSGRLESACKC